MTDLRLLQAALVIVALLPGLTAKSTPWVYSTDDAVPEDTIRVTTLGSGTPDVRRHQVRTGLQAHITTVLACVSVIRCTSSLGSEEGQEICCCKINDGFFGMRGALLTM